MDRYRSSFFVRYMMICICLGLTLPLWSQFGGGSGTETDPYLVQNATHLYNVRSYPSACFLQTADIDLNIAPYNQGVGWWPIGSYMNNPFSGTYNGASHIISNLYTNGSSPSGLFGHVAGGELANIRLTNVNVSSGGWSVAGGLTGQADNAVIENCLVSGSVFGEAYIGGLVGYSMSSTYVNCCADCSVQSNGYSGGLIGYAETSTITSCYASGLLGPQQQEVAGGFVAYLVDSTVSNCYARTALIAGIMSAGFSAEVDGGFLTNCYYAGVITDPNDMASGLLGGVVDNPAIVNCYWDTTLSGTTQSAGGLGRTTAEMTYPYAANTYVEWNFQHVWAADSSGLNGGYPYLRSFDQTGVVAVPVFSHQTGYYNNPFLLTLSSATPNAVIFYTLDGSLPNAQSAIYSAPLYISQNTTVRAFASRTGWLDSGVVNATYYLNIFSSGDGTPANPYLVSTPDQLYAVRLAPDACYRQDADIDMNVPPYNNGSGFEPTGYYTGETWAYFSGVYDGYGWNISNLFIDSDNLYTGLFGYVSFGEIRNVKLVNANVSGGWRGGCLIGNCESSIVQNCSVSGSMQGANVAGGLIGFASVTQISNCCSYASVQGGAAGGLLDELYMQSSLTNCYSTGLVTSNTSTHGGLIAVNFQNEGIITNSYWNTETSGQATSGGGFGRTTAEMTYPYANNTYSGWNFTSIWQHDPEGINGGYPCLKNPRVVANPVITYTTPQIGGTATVTLQCATAGVSMFYTIDGTEPTQSSTLYAEPFVVESDEDSTVVVKARAFRNGYAPSQVASVTLWFGHQVDVQDMELPIPVLSCKAYPNPSRGQTSLKLSLPSSGSATLDIYNCKGELVRSLPPDYLSKGVHTLQWDGTGNDGKPASPGIYLITLRHNGKTRTTRLIIIR